MNRSILIGSDTEIGNFVLGVDSAHGTGQLASRALLGQTAGVPQSPSYTHQCKCPACQRSRQDDLFESGGSPTGGVNPQDWGRKFLPTNGGSAYIDLDHFELCTPEVVSAHDWVAVWHAMLVTARGAMDRVNQTAPQGVRLQVLVNNSDGMSHSYGGHLSYLLTRRTWDNIFHRKLHYMLFLAAHQVSSLVYTGQGKVGAENGRPQTEYQISQRADFFETLTGTQTTVHRPIVNSRDEPLCGPTQHFVSSHRADDGWARLHVIFYDSNLCHVACLLKAGVMQIILAMLEAGRLNPQLILDDPLEAVVSWSHDPDLRARARMASGQRLTAIELQMKFFDEAQTFVAQEGCDGVVPRSAEIMELWADTLTKLHDRDFDALAARLDWVLKRLAIERAIVKHPNLTWTSPEVKHLDHLYSSLDVSDGLYWAYQQAGVVERVVSPAQIERFVHEPPVDTRAWTRAMLLRRAGAGQISFMDWDVIRFRISGARGWPSFPTVHLADPLGATKTDTALFFDAGDALEDVLENVESISRNRHEESHETLEENHHVGVPLLPAPVNAQNPIPTWNDPGSSGVA